MSIKIQADSLVLYLPLLVFFVNYKVKQLDEPICILVGRRS